MKKTHVSFSVCALVSTLLFSGCVSDVTVERGAVMESTVTDASGQTADIVQNSNKYTFERYIEYPVFAKDGYIDVDADGRKSVGDLNLDIELKAYSGSIITLITTAIADENPFLREKKLQFLAKKLSVPSNELLMLPSESYYSAILSNELYKRIKTNPNLTLSDIILNMETNGLVEAFNKQKEKIDKNMTTKEFAVSLEKEYINQLIKKGKVKPFTIDDIVSSDDYKLSIFHVNDTHSHITSEQMSFYINGEKTYIPVGGYARYVTKLNELKKAKPNSLTLNAGDVFQGTLYYSLFKGEADAAAMNLISWDAYALGNHEFDDGDEGLKSFLGMLKNTPVVAANVVPKAGNILENMWTPYVVKEVNGEKVGIIGIDIVSKTKYSSNPSNEIEFLDETITAQKYIDELTSQGVDKIILLTHQGYQNDIEMAKKLTGVDVIVGGDSHSLIGNFESFGLSSESNNYPTRVNSKDNKKVCIVQAWEYGHILGDLDIVFDKNGEVLACEGNPLLLIGDEFRQKDSNRKKQIVDINKKASIMKVIEEDDNIVVTLEDENTLKVVDEFEKQVDVKKALVIGTSSVKLGHNRIPMDKKDGNSLLPLGSDIAPIVAKSFYDLSNLADACIQNAGGVRIAIDSGEITMGDAYTLLPFANTLFEIEMKGSEVKQVLEDALSFSKESSGAFPYAYALKYDVDLSASDNNKVSNLEIKDRKTGVWSDIELDKMYTIVTNSYIAAGKDGYTTFKTVQDERGKGTDTYLDYAMSFVKYVETKANAGEEVGKLPTDEHPIKSFINADGFSSQFSSKIATLKTNKEGGTEIVAYDSTTKKIFTTNGANNTLDITPLTYDVATKTTTLGTTNAIDLSTYGAGVQSVAVANGKVAVAVASSDNTATKGSVVVFDTAGTHLKTVEAGYLPDMVTFSEDGTKILVANEGEPNSDYSVDPKGSVGIIEVNDYTYTDLTFDGITIPSDVVIKKGSTAAVDLEPEYITVSGTKAYVALQENNALAIVDIASKTIEKVVALGFKDYSKEENTIDIEENGKAELKNFAGLYGMYQPDSIASYKVAGKTYIVTANEGDGREYGAYENESKIKKLDLADSIKATFENDNDLKVNNELGKNANGKYEKLYTFGARSFSIWDENGILVFDSADELAKLTLKYMTELFNQDDGEIDKRSGNKGVEPEALAIGKVDEKTYAFVGLERQNAIVIFDITSPTDVKFVEYINTQESGDISPEGMKFVSATNSPTGKPLLLVAFEVSGSTAVYEIKQ